MLGRNLQRAAATLCPKCGDMGHPYVTLSTIVATVSVLPASIAFLGRRSLPPFVTYALTHAAISGFAVALAASPPIAAITTGMLGKVSPVEQFQPLAAAQIIMQ